MRPPASKALVAQDIDAWTELRHLRAYLIDLADLIEPHPGIEAASDDLYQAASAFVATAIREAPTLLRERRARLLREAYLRLQDRLLMAEPSKAAKAKAPA